MKRNILTIAVAVTGIHLSFAQTGNVGINTNNPQETHKKPYMF